MILDNNIIEYARKEFTKHKDLMDKYIKQGWGCSVWETDGDFYTLSYLDGKWRLAYDRKCKGDEIEIDFTP